MRSLLVGRSFKAILALICGAFVVTSASTGDQANVIYADAKKVAISGYDTVAYFTVAKALKGKPEFYASWQDVTWHFANGEHRDLFVADPTKYSPQFGGFCAMALTRGVVKTIDPEAWVIVDGRLYLNFSDDARKRFEHDIRSNIEKSENNWAELQAQN